MQMSGAMRNKATLGSDLSLFCPTSNMNDSKHTDSDVTDGHPFLSTLNYNLHLNLIASKCLFAMP